MSISHNKTAEIPNTNTHIGSSIENRGIAAPVLGFDAAATADAATVFVLVSVAVAVAVGEVLELVDILVLETAEVVEL